MRLHLPWGGGGETGEYFTPLQINAQIADRGRNKWRHQSILPVPCFEAQLAFFEEASTTLLLGLLIPGMYNVGVGLSKNWVLLIPTLTSINCIAGNFSAETIVC